MTAQSILRKLWEAGIRLRLTNDGLNLSAPAGVLSSEQRALLLIHKAELVAFLLDVQTSSKDLIKTAMKVCDRYEDNDLARVEMQLQSLETPAHLHADLLEHLRTESKKPYATKRKTT